MLIAPTFFDYFLQCGAQIHDSTLTQKSLFFILTSSFFAECKKSATFASTYVFIHYFIMNTKIRLPLASPHFFTDNNGNSIFVLSNEYYNELLQTIEKLSEDLDDIRAIEDERASPSPAEPIDIFFERVERYRAKNGI